VHRYPGLCLVAVKNRIVTSCAAMYLERMSACSDAVQRVTAAVLYHMMWWGRERWTGYESIWSQQQEVRKRCANRSLALG
jgi:hypothetical protein